MNSSKLETEQAPECSPRGRGRGRGVRGRGQNQCNSPRNSPTASRRPAQALYTPGAFSKQRKNTDSQARQAAPNLVESPTNVRNKNTVLKTFIKTEALPEKSEVSKSQQVDKFNSRDQQDCDSGMLEDEKSFECNFNKLDVSSPTSSLVEMGLKDKKEKNNRSYSPTDITSKRINNFEITDAVATDAVATDVQPDYIDSNCDNVTNNLQSYDNIGQSIHFDCSVSNLNNKVDNKIMSENCRKQEKVSTKSEDTLSVKTSTKPIQLEVPAMKELGTNTSELSDSNIFLNERCGSEKTSNESEEKEKDSEKGVDNRKSVNVNEKQLAETNIDYAVDSVTKHLRTNTESMADGESNIHDNNTNADACVEFSGCAKPVSDIFDITEEEISGSSQTWSEMNNEVNKITLEKNERIMVFSESKENDKAQTNSKPQHSKENLNDKDDKMENNESLVGNESKENDEAQSKSKPQHSKENLNDKSDKIEINESFVGNETNKNDEAQSKGKQRHSKEDLNGIDDKIALGNNERVMDHRECDEKVETQTTIKWQNKEEDLSNEDDKIVRGNNESIESTENKEKVQAKTTFNDDHKIRVTLGKNEILVDGENKRKVESQSKSKRQSKKEEKAKKKEEKLRKKQVKTKSEKTVKKSEVEEKITAKEVEVHELGNREKNRKEIKIQYGKEKQTGKEEKTMAKGGEVLDPGKKGKSNKVVMIQQGKEKQENSIAGDQGLKIVRECKDTLLKVSVSTEDHILNEEDSEDSGEEDWEKTWDDDGECVDADVLAQLNEQIDTTNIQVVKPQFDYFSFKPNDIILEKGVFDHVAELYDFSPEFKSHDLINGLSNFQQQGFEIHWVDDTHALAVFSNHRTAQQAIEQCSNPMLKLRPLYEGTQKSKLKAKRNVDLLQPYKERPKTTKLIANRLVAGALGMTSKMSKEERQLEREKIKTERERKLNKEKQKRDLWESDDL